MIRKLKKIDPVIMFILGCFIFFSTLVIYSAATGGNFGNLHINNIILYAASFIPFIVVAFTDYRIIIHSFSYLFYTIGIGLLLLVQVMGQSINGSKRWIGIGSFQFQPSELMKILLILVLAHVLSRREGQPLRFIKDIIPLGVLAIIPFYQIFKQPDLGTALVLVSICLGMIWIGNLKVAHLALGAALLTVIISGIILLHSSNPELLSKFVKPHQMDRIQTFLDPSSNPDKSWHVRNSIIAIGTGELYGKGYLQGSYVQGGFVPYDYSDSIFVVIGEEFGFVGSSILLMLYMIFIYRMIQIAIQCKDLSGTYLIVGIISMFTFQIFENIAMHIGILPLTGISLPFISYGGSSLFTNMIAMGLVMSVRIHHDQPLLWEGFRLRRLLR
ncbi:rod shape-determining protein RodA [Paenibacillus larvae]